MPNKTFVSVLARSFLAGEPTVEDIVARSTAMLGRPWRWLSPLAKRYVQAIAGKTRPRHREVVQFLLGDPGFESARLKYFDQLSVGHWSLESQPMQPVAAARDWNVPPIETPGALADWFRLSTGDLEWFADLKGLGHKKNVPSLSHYNYRVLTKQFGNIRLIEAPKPRLKELQTTILAEILERLPSHPAAHGFVKGRSIKTFVAPHVGQRVVLRMDLQDFFPSFRAARIQTLFRTLGYPEPVADLLGGICTNAAPAGLWKNQSREVDQHCLERARNLYSRPHLPQGAPTSPAVANACAYRLDCRLAGLAKAAGAQYTRYADDLAFSGNEEFERRVERFSLHVAAVLLEESFTVHHRKTRIMRQGVRQHLAGLVTNERTNVIRADFDRLKATLTNCARHGPASQNRDAHPAFRAHLDGRIAFVEMVNPSKATRLRRIFNQIHW